MNIAARLNEIEGLEDGWLDGINEGRAIKKRHLEWFRSMMSKLLEIGVQKPHLYPTPTGGIQAEWSLSGWEISAEFEFEENQLYLHADNEEHDYFFDQTMPLDAPLLLREVAEFIDMAVLKASILRGPED